MPTALHFLAWHLAVFIICLISTPVDSKLRTPNTINKIDDAYDERRVEVHGDLFHLRMTHDTRYRPVSTTS